MRLSGSGATSPGPLFVYTANSLYQKSEIVNGEAFMSALNKTLAKNPKSENKTNCIINEHKVLRLRTVIIKFKS